MFQKDGYVLMADHSVRAIQNVQVGDIVASDAGPSKVESVNNKYYSGKITEHFISNNVSIACLPETEIKVLSSNASNPNVRRAVRECGKIKTEYIEIGNVNKEKNLFINYINNNIIDSDLNENKSRILGLYAAEGSLLGKRGILFSFGHHEIELVNFCKDLIKKEYQIKGCLKTFNDSSKISLYVNSESLFNDCKKHVGKLSQKKSLSKELIFGPNNVKLQFITGWLEGDGYCDKYSGKLVGTTVSVNMATQIHNMYNSLRISNGFYFQLPFNSILKDGRKINGNYNIYRIKVPYNYGKEILNKSKKLFKTKNVKNVKRHAFVNNYRIFSSLDNNVTDFAGQLFSLTLQNNHPYVINNILVRSCHLL